MYRVILGAAHTMMQPGEIFQDLKEAELTRKILSKTLPYLTKSGFTFQTVPLDLPLIQRIDWINNTGYLEEEGDIFVEIHVNDGGKRGIENWYSGDDKGDNPSKVLAEFLADEMCKELKFDNQGTKSEYDHELGSLLILNQTKTISIATELLYIDNPEDIAILKDDAKLDNLAKTLVDTIKKYIEDAKKRPLPKKSSKNITMGTGAAPSAGGFPPLPFGAGSSLPNLNFPGSTPASPASSSAAKTPVLMDREQRKKMVVDTYKKILGSEPKQADLNLHLNIATNEEDLIKKLVDSPDHKDLVKEAKEAKEIKSKSKDSEAELAKLRSQVNDLNQMHKNLNQLLQHKNQIILQMQQELVRRNVVKKGQYFSGS